MHEERKQPLILAQLGARPELTCSARVRIEELVEQLAWLAFGDIQTPQEVPRGPDKTGPWRRILKVLAGFLAGYLRSAIPEDSGGAQGQVDVYFVMLSLAQQLPRSRLAAGHLGPQSFMRLVAASAGQGVASRVHARAIYFDARTHCSAPIYTVCLATRKGFMRLVTIGRRRLLATCCSEPGFPRVEGWAGLVTARLQMWRADSLQA